MKSSKLIELLQKEDPTGDGEVCISGSEGNADIFNLEWKAGYWDGAYQVLKRNWASEYYNVIGAEYRSDGDKLCIRPMTIEDALLNDPELPIEVFDDFCQKKMADEVASWREVMRKIKDEINDHMFFKVMEKLKEGHRIFQNKEDPIGKYFVMYWDIKDKSGILNDKTKWCRLVSGECGIVLKSGFFKHVEREKNIEWVFSLQKD
jgi:hypothetical protein